MKERLQNHCATRAFEMFVDIFPTAIAVICLLFPLSEQAASAQGGFSSQSKMSNMLNQFEQGSRPTYTTGSGRSGGRPSGMPGYANMMSGRPSNMGGYAGRGNNNSQMMQLMKQKMSRMQSGGGGQGQLLQMMQKRSGGAPNMMPGMGGGMGMSGMGASSGLFARMMQQEAGFNKNMKRQQMSHGMGMPGGMLGRMKQSGMGSGMGMGQSGMGSMGALSSGMLGRMNQQKLGAPRAGSPFAPKQAAPAKTGAMSDLEKQFEGQYGK